MPGNRGGFIGCAASRHKLFVFLIAPAQAPLDHLRITSPHLQITLPHLQCALKVKVMDPKSIISAPGLRKPL